MPRARAELTRVRCRATSKRTGERCGAWCAPGHVVCRWHGGARNASIRSARVREAVAEILAADPRRSPREVMGDALHVSDLVMQDKIAALRDAESITPETAVELTDAATRAAALARAAADMGVVVDLEADPAHGELVVAALSRVARRLLGSWSAMPGSDYAELESWLVSAVPAALRGLEVGVPPRLWSRPRPVMPSRQLESSAVVRYREARDLEEALEGVGGSETDRDGSRGGVHTGPGRSSPQGRVRLVSGGVPGAPPGAPVGVRDVYAARGGPLTGRRGDG